MGRRLVVMCLWAASVAWLTAQRPALSGEWEGAVQIPGFELRLVIDLDQNNQQWVGSLTAPQFEVKGAQLTGITVKENDVEFGLKRGLSFKARLEPGGVLKGEYTQGGNKAPFLLKRVGEAHVDFPEVSTAVSADVQGEWKGALQLPSTAITLILRLPGGGTPTAPTGELELVEAGNQKIPITLWKQDGNTVLAMMGDGALSYRGEFRKDNDEIAGSLRLGGAELPVTFHRNTTKTSAPATAQPAAK